MDSWGITNNGKVRSVNQDVYKILSDSSENTTIIVVCDGMGGANAGNVASALAAEVFADYVSSRFDRDDSDSTLDDIADIVAEAAIKANKAVYDKGLFDIECNGMGTTLVAFVSTNLGEVVANIGDSRAYHITKYGITRITKDHSVVEELIDRGEITRDEANIHPRKNLITRAIGADLYVEADVFMQQIDSGDIVLLCTDGLTNLVSDDEIFETLQNNSILSDACDYLMNIAMERGAPDNVTIAIYRK